jgi:DNA repair exonuclease SbcCD ATPase subunit
MKKMKYAFSFLFLFAGLLIIAGCANTVSAENAYVTLDINPSVELIVTPKEKVIYANPLNEDGEVLLADLQLVGLDLDDAIELIIETAVELGYIDVDEEETIVSVTAISKNSQIGELIRNKVKEHVNNAFKERAMVGRAEDKEDNGYVPAFLEEAQSYEVSPGFLFLAKKAVFVNDELTLEVAVEMEVDELQAIIREAFEDHKEIATTLKDEFLAARQELFDEYLPQFEDYDAQIEDLEMQIVDLEAQIELGEGDVEALEAEKADLEAQLAALQEEFATLRAEFKEKLMELRDEFLEETKALREQFKQMHQHLRETHQQRVQEFRDEMESRRDELMDRIEEFQRNRP